MTEPVDFRKELKELYSASRTRTAFVEVPSLNYLMMDGEGHPSGVEFQEVVSTLYPVAYTLKFMVRDRGPRVNYRVMPLEVCWAVDRQVHGRFTWTVMILQPDFITAELVALASEEAQKGRDLPQLSRMRFETQQEGWCAQMMHVGPYENMNDTLAIMRTQAGAAGWKTLGDTHDIYLNDMRKTKPENLRVLMRIKIEKDA